MCKPVFFATGLRTHAGPGDAGSETKRRGARGRPPPARGAPAPKHTRGRPARQPAPKHTRAAPQDSRPELLSNHFIAYVQPPLARRRPSADKGRKEFGKVLENNAGGPVDLMKTADYNIAIEAIASGKAQLADLGAGGFIQAQKKNSEVKSLVTTADTDGKLDGAKHFSSICVPADQMDSFKDSPNKTGYSIKIINGKRMSFVSATSTSGFKVPSNAIMKVFPNDVKSSDTANYELLFAPKDQDNTSTVWSKGDTAGFIKVEDSWYDPIRALEYRAHALSARHRLRQARSPRIWPPGPAARPPWGPARGAAASRSRSPATSCAAAPAPSTSARACTTSATSYPSPF